MRVPLFRFASTWATGKHLDINHPELAFLSRISLHVGEGVTDPRTEIPPRTSMVSPLHVVRLEPLVAA
ncbi:MAG: hypothetical protein M3505_09395 [Verrucomicrobiota bacterium]|nr:hypothetical protein [Verrucomicrobiota bacterium]